MFYFITYLCLVFYSQQSHGSLSLSVSYPYPCTGLRLQVISLFYIQPHHRSVCSGTHTDIILATRMPNHGRVPPLESAVHQSVAHESAQTGARYHESAMTTRARCRNSTQERRSEERSHQKRTVKFPSGRVSKFQSQSWKLWKVFRGRTKLRFADSCTVETGRLRRGLYGDAKRRNVKDGLQCRHFTWLELRTLWRGVNIATHRGCEVTVVKLANVKNAMLTHASTSNNPPGRILQN